MRADRATRLTVFALAPLVAFALSSLPGCSPADVPPAAPGFALAYDARRDGVGFAPYVVAAIWLIGLCVAPGIFRLAVRDGANKGLMLVWLAAWILAGAVGVTNVFASHFRCARRLRTGDFRVAEGTITNFVPMPYGGHTSERFIVGRTEFSYSDFDLSKGGFRHTASHGGPLRQGLYVRIAHHDGVILASKCGKDSDFGGPRPGLPPVRGVLAVHPRVYA